MCVPVLPVIVAIQHNRHIGVAVPPVVKVHFNIPVAAFRQYRLLSTVPMYTFPSATAGEEPTASPVLKPHRVWFVLGAAEDEELVCAGSWRNIGHSSVSGLEAALACGARFMMQKVVAIRAMRIGRAASFFTCSPVV